MAARLIDTVRRHPWWPGHGIGRSFASAIVLTAWCLSACLGPGSLGPHATAVAGPPDRPLRAAIDAAVAAEAVGPSAARCSDADFIRRVHLDLTGVIPPVATVRAFLATEDTDKRERLVDELLDDRAFARHMMFVLDAMLLERDTPPGDLATAWREYLFAALDDDVPLDALVRDLLTVDGADPQTRPAAAFLLTRQAEPVQLTRAIGRLFFGRDLQCAQCHDHPLIDDIRQSEHQGLYAFVARTSQFKGKNNTLLISEKADGEVDYRSVFTQEGQQGVWPRLPGGTTLLDEPRPEPADAYTTIPSKTQHGVPVFSRRAALAALLADDFSFRRNLANRIWAMFFGRGIVHPLDGHGVDNPPANPRLLDLLAAALVEHDFRLRPLVREIVLSETYQRSIDPPAGDAVDVPALGAIVARLAEERSALAKALAAAQPAADAAEQRLEEARASAHAIHLERLGLITARDKARTAADAAAAAAAKADADRVRTAAVSAALDAATAVVAKAAAGGGDEPLATLATTLRDRAARKQAEAAKEAETAAAKRAATDAATAALAAAREAVATATARLDAAGLRSLERAATTARRQAIDTAQRIARIDARLELAGDLVTHATLRLDDPTAAAIAWESIVDRWTVIGQVAPLRALSAEQLALSVQQATGSLATRQASAAAAIDKQPPPELAQASAEERPEVRAVQVEMRMVKDAAGLLKSAAALFGDTLSEGFQASVNQALYFGNAPDVQGQLAPSGTNLVATLATMSDPGAVADEAYVAVLSRPPTDAERADVAAFLEPRAADRPQALAELVWALLSSNEFRFNH